MKRVFSFIAAMVMALSVMFVTAGPAAAGDCSLFGSVCGKLWHVSDAGYDPSIKVRCNYGDPDTVQYIYEGQNSMQESKCGQYGNGDMDEVYIRSGEELWCDQGLYWAKEFDATGWHKVNDLWHNACTLHKD